MTSTPQFGAVPLGGMPPRNLHGRTVRNTTTDETFSITKSEAGIRMGAKGPEMAVVLWDADNKQRTFSVTDIGNGAAGIAELDFVG